MTDSRISEDSDPESRAAMAALARLMAAASGPSAAWEPVPGAESDADERLVREYLEILGLLPYELAPMAPSPEVRERILAPIDDRSATVPPRRGFEEVSGAGTIPFPGPRRALAPAPTRSRWTGALAAALVVCIGGLAYLGGRVNEQHRTIARLGDELRRPVAELSSLRAELATMERRFNMVTAVARKAYHLQGVERLGDRPVDGVVYVCGLHQRWYLNVQGLETPPAGREYRLWFVTDEGMIGGGLVRVEADAQAEMEATTMPRGTRGFAITLEEAGNDVRPEGIMVLLGEESVSL